MSTDKTETENVTTTTTPKKNRQLSQEQLDTLAIARQKANLVRKQKSDEKSQIRKREQESITVIVHVTVINHVINPWLTKIVIVNVNFKKTQYIRFFYRQ
jgi:hypothetical protein